MMNNQIIEERTMTDNPEKNNVMGSTLRFDGPPPADVSWITRKYLNIQYAFQSVNQKLDIYLPEEGHGPFPVLVHIHGGAFKMCNKDDIQMIPFLGLLKEGYAVVSVEYRMSGEAIFPAAVMDCKAAIRWLRKNADTYHLDSAKFAAVGGSAGGNISAMIATSDGILEMEDLSQGNEAFPSNVQAGVIWFGPTDFLKMDEQLASLNIGPLDHNEADSPESLYMGGKITELAPEYVQKANPMTYIRENMPPLLIQHGDQDHLVCVLQSQIFVDAIEAKLGKERCEYEILHGQDHGGPDFGSEKNMKKVLCFLNKHLKG